MCLRKTIICRIIIPDPYKSRDKYFVNINSKPIKLLKQVVSMSEAGLEIAVTS